MNPTCGGGVYCQANSAGYCPKCHEPRQTILTDQARETLIGDWVRRHERSAAPVVEIGRDALAEPPRLTDEEIHQLAAKHGTKHVYMAFARAIERAALNVQAKLSGKTDV